MKLSIIIVLVAIVIAILVILKLSVREPDMYPDSFLQSENSQNIFEQEQEAPPQPPVENGKDKG